MRAFRAFSAAPYPIRVSAGLCAFEAAVWAVVAVTSARAELPGPSQAAFILGLAIGVLLLASLFALPAAIVASRYPRRRHQEAIVFQALLLLVFVDGFASHPSFAGAALFVAALSAVCLLLLPTTRKYVANREARFAAAVKGDR